MTESVGAFFYGTLLHPKVLKRVIGNDGTHLQICPAVLPDYTRHHIKDCDYPGVLPYERSRQLFDHELSREERSVRGNFVLGLSKSDIEYLDVFEGDEYTKEFVYVYPLGPLEPLNNPSQSIVPTSSEKLPENLSGSVKATVYIWSDSVLRLVPELWSYDTFVKDNAWKWVGDTEEDSYAEVDRRREMNGVITRTPKELHVETNAIGVSV